MGSTPRFVASALVLSGVLSLAQFPGIRAHASSRPAIGEVTAAYRSYGELEETDQEQQFVDLLNQERTRRGLNELVIDPYLIGIARSHSEEMRQKKYFGHESPTSGIKTPMDRYLKVVARPGYACVGENLFYCDITDVRRGHNAFMNSPTHRENILFPRYEKVGVGIVKTGDGRFWVTEMFLTNRDPLLTAHR